MAAQQQIETLEQALTAALRVSDRAAMERHVAPEFRLVGIRSTGAHDMLRQEWLDVSLGMNFHWIEVDVRSVEVYGDTAIASVEGDWRVDWQGRAIDERFLLTDVWIKRKGAWQLVRRHSSPFQS